MPQVGIYWFIYVITGIYLLTPLLSSYLNRCPRADVRLLLLLWGATLVLPYAAHYVPELAALTELHHGILHCFNGFVGFAILGFYLRRHVQPLGRRDARLALAAATAIALVPWFAYAFTSVPHQVIQDRLTLPTAAMATCYFLALRSLPLQRRLGRLCYDFAQHSFGIYLVHHLILRDLVWPLLRPLGLHYALQVPLVVVLTAGLSYLVVHLLAKLPGSKYFVGL